jgi:hypothetical protein
MANVDFCKPNRKKEASEKRPCHMAAVGDR